MIDLTRDDDAAEPKTLKCGLCRSTIGTSEQDPPLMVLVDCGHTMCAPCFAGPGFMKRPNGKDKECPFCMRKRGGQPSDAPLGVRAFLNVQ